MIGAHAPPGRSRCPCVLWPWKLVWWHCHFAIDHLQELPSRFFKFPPVALFTSHGKTPQKRNTRAATLAGSRRLTNWVGESALQKPAWTCHRSIPPPGPQPLVLVILMASSWIYRFLPIGCCWGFRSHAWSASSRTNVATSNQETQRLGENAMSQTGCTKENPFKTQGFNHVRFWVLFLWVKDLQDGSCWVTIIIMIVRIIILFIITITMIYFTYSISSILLLLPWGRTLLAKEKLTDPDHIQRLHCDNIRKKHGEVPPSPAHKGPPFHPPWSFNGGTCHVQVDPLTKTLRHMWRPPVLQGFLNPKGMHHEGMHTQRNKVWDFRWPFTHNSREVVRIQQIYSTWIKRGTLTCKNQDQQP